MTPQYCWWMLAPLLACASLVAGQPGAQCVVRDPELQGSYIGKCKDGYAEGDGEAQGIAHYRGQFKAGRKHGDGVKSWPAGDRYVGQFANDNKDGFGAYTWGAGSLWSGEKYRGHYRNDRRHGMGTYEWPNGARYDGPWENDLVAGQPPTQLYARSRAMVEIETAVTTPNARICQRVTVGVATQDWVRGTVIGTDHDRIRIRIDDAGNFRRSRSGVAIEAGQIIWDSWQFWIPCL